MECLSTAWYRAGTLESAAVVCNAVLFVLTGVIVLTEGVPRAAHYQVLTLLVLLMPLLSAVVLVRERLAARGPGTDGGGSSAATLAKRAAVLGNVVLFGAACWEGVAQYPYPEGNSLIPLVVLAVGTPILSLTALLRGRRQAMGQERRSTAGGP